MSALSSEAFSGLYLNGFLKEKDTTFYHRVKVVFFVTTINLVMGLAGFLVGLFLDNLLSDISFGLSLGLLFILGLKLIIKSFKPKFQEMTWELTNQKVLLGFSLAVSINTFLLGLALPGLTVTIIPAITIILIVFFLSSIIALIVGSKSSKFLLASRFLLIGGVVIMGSAIYYLIQNFNYI